MSAPSVAPPADVTTDARRKVSGGVRVRERVIEKVVRESSAAAIRVPRREVNVEVSERCGGLVVRVAAKLPVPDLDDTDAIRAEPPIVSRMRQVQQALAEEFARLTGREVRRVSFTVTGAIVPERKRVR